VDGAQRAVAAAVAAGIEVCFANPGTTELPLVRALDAVPGIRPVLGLFEGVCTGAADGWGRLRGEPALTLLHLGPGLANGLANLHNARRARTPVVNLVGDMATWHRAADAPLASDVASLARPVSGWVRTAEAPVTLADDVAAAIGAARTGLVATLIAPADVQAGPAPPRPDPVAPAPAPPAAGDDAVEAAARALAAGAAVLLLGGAGLSVRGLRAAARIADATGARLVGETFPARQERGAGLPAPEKLPYFPDQALAALAGSAAVVLAGAPSPVAFFGYPGVPSSTVPPGTPVVALAAPEQDVAAALERVADRLPARPPFGEPPAGPPPRDLGDPALAPGPLTPRTAGAVLAALQPEGAVVVDEAATSGAPYFGLAAAAPPHTYLALTGGAIGQGLPCAAGAAIAAPDRPVVAFQADGSGMYTVQALWTLAREGLDVTVLVCANRSYRILRAELLRAGATSFGPAATGLTDLGGPALDWTSLAAGMGVPASRAETAGQLAGGLRAALAAPGPHLIELVL